MILDDFEKWFEQIDTVSQIIICGECDFVQAIECCIFGNYQNGAFYFFDNICRIASYNQFLQSRGSFGAHDNHIYIIFVDMLAYGIDKKIVICKRKKMMVIVFWKLLCNAL